MKKLYKVLNKDMISPFQNFKYEIGKEYICKDFDENKDNDCSRGFYATDIEGLPYSFNINRQVGLCEVSGKKVEIDEFKRRYEKIKIIKEIPHNEIKELAKQKEPKVGYKLSEVLFPVNPLELKSGQVTKQDIKLLIKWDSVRASVSASVRASVWDSVWDSVSASVWDSVSASVRASVWDSVSASVCASVRASVWDSVRDSVWDSVSASVRDSVSASVWDSVSAYIGSLFPNIEKWEYIKHKKGAYPFQPAVDLWYRGFVPSYDGKYWRLHSGKNADVVYELKEDSKCIK